MSSERDHLIEPIRCPGGSDDPSEPQPGTVGGAMAAPDVAGAVPIAAPGMPRRRRLARVSLGHLLMVVAGLLAILTNLALLRSADDRVLVAVAARDLPTGSFVTELDLRLAPVAAEPDVLGQLIGQDRVAGVDGIAVRDLRAGDLVKLADLAAPAGPDRRRAMSIPIDRQHAVGGNISVGDRIDVVGTRDGAAAFVVSGLEVIDVAGTGVGPLSNRDFYITVALFEDEVLRVAEALEDGSIQVILSTGAHPIEPFGEAIP